MMSLCRGWESNPHDLRLRILSPLCLPFHHPGGSIIVCAIYVTVHSFDGKAIWRSSKIRTDGLHNSISLRYGQGILILPSWAIWRSSNATVCKTVMGGCDSHCGLMTRNERWTLI